VSSACAASTSWNCVDEEVAVLAARVDDVRTPGHVTGKADQSAKSTAPRFFIAASYAFPACSAM
jgi:hypothetical protein